jgi:hypothetical protein
LFSVASHNRETLVDTSGTASSAFGENFSPIFFVISHLIMQALNAFFIAVALVSTTFALVENPPAFDNAAASLVIPKANRDSYWDPNQVIKWNDAAKTTYANIVVTQSPKYSVSLCSNPAGAAASCYSTDTLVGSGDALQAGTFLKCKLIAHTNHANPMAYSCSSISTVGNLPFVLRLKNGKITFHGLSDLIDWAGKPIADYTNGVLSWHKYSDVLQTIEANKFYGRKRLVIAMAHLALQYEHRTKKPNVVGPGHMPIDLSMFPPIDLPELGKPKKD